MVFLPPVKKGKNKGKKKKGVKALFPFLSFFLLSL
jgi:hypothetical protein